MHDFSIIQMWDRSECSVSLKGLMLAFKLPLTLASLIKIQINFVAKALKN